MHWELHFPNANLQDEKFLQLFPLTAIQNADTQPAQVTHEQSFKLCLQKKLKD